MDIEIEQEVEGCFDIYLTIPRDNVGHVFVAFALTLDEARQFRRELGRAFRDERQLASI